MEEQVQGPKPLKGFSIAGIIVGAVALLFSFGSFAPGFLSAFGAMALPFAWPALVLGILGLIFAMRAKVKKTAAIIAIVMSIAAIGIAYYGISSAMSDPLGEYSDEFEDALKNLENLELE